MKRKRKKRRTRRKTGFALFGRNPKRRKRRRVVRNAPYRRARRRSFRRNPPSFQAIGNELLSSGIGFMATKVVGNMVSPMVAQVMPQAGDLGRIATKFGIAYLTAWTAEQFFGKRWFMPVMIGGSIEGIQDTVRTYISPVVPMLAAAEYPLEIYEEQPLLPSPDGMGTYLGIGTYFDQMA